MGAPVHSSPARGSSADASQATVEHPGFSASTEGRHRGPLSAFDYLVVVVAVVIVAVVFVLLIKLLIWPGESSPDHIKRRILRDEPTERQP